VEWRGNEREADESALRMGSGGRDLRERIRKAEERKRENERGKVGGRVACTVINNIPGQQKAYNECD